MQLARNLFYLPTARLPQGAGSTAGHTNRAPVYQAADFTLYANQIFLGHGAYGYEAASEYYFSKPAKN